MPRTLDFITSHPLSGKRPLAAVLRFARWQIESRLKQDVEFNWIEGSKLIVRKGMTGAIGNIYCGLHEYADMAFLLHFLRPDDVFVDVGANVGSYTVLASAICGAKTLAIEPDPGTVRALQANIDVNQINHLVEVNVCAAGPSDGTVVFTKGQDTMNQVTSTSGPSTQRVKQKRLDDIVGAAEPTFIKLDVEGYEAQALEGANVTLSKHSLLAVATESENDAVTRILERAGFGRYYYNPISRTLEQSPQSIKGSNALFLRHLASCAERVAAAPVREIIGQRV